MRVLLDWHAENSASGEPEPDAMCLATTTREGAPSARVVLFRGVLRGRLCFYTNYASRKGDELAANPRAAALFHFVKLARQVRVEGTVEKLTAEESDAYFARRPRGHQVGAWASQQSRPLGSLEELAARVAELEARFEGKDVPRPEGWGGYGLLPQRVELWQGRLNRLHERRLFEREGEGWRESLLSP